MSKTTIKDLAELLERVQAEISILSKRVEKLETAGPKTPAMEEVVPAQATPLPAPRPDPAKPEIAEEELIAISAALAAYLGVRVRIKQIRLLSSHAWAQQGRVSIQASHKLHN